MVATPTRRGTAATAPTRRAAPAPAPQRQRRVEEPAPRAQPRRAAAAPARAAKPEAENKFAGTTPVREKLGTTALFDFIAEHADVDRKTARACVAALTDALVGSMHPKGCGVFVLPGALRVIAKEKVQKAVRGGQEVPDPFRPGETKITKARAARKFNVVRVRPSRHLKQFAM